MMGRSFLLVPLVAGLAGRHTQERRLAPAGFSALCLDYSDAQIAGISAGRSSNCAEVLIVALNRSKSCSSGVSEVFESAVGLSQTVADICCATCSPGLVTIKVEVDNEGDLSDVFSQKKVVYDINLTANITVSKPFWVAGRKRLAGKGNGIILSGGGQKSIFNVADGGILQLEDLTMEDARGTAVCVNHGADLFVLNSEFRNNRNVPSRRLQERGGRSLASDAFPEDCAGKATGLYNITLASGLQIPVYCDGTTDGGGWMLLLSHADIFDQYTCEKIPTLHGCPGMPGSKDDVTTYPGSASPFGHDISAESPTPASAYSRNWTATGLDPQLGDEFLLKRGSSGDWVRFVQLGPWCGWDQTRNCMEWVDRDTQHGFYTMGTVYDSQGQEFSGGGASGKERFKYFNSCTKAGGCMRSGCDGVGFGVLESHLRATDGNGGFGGTWGPPCFRWNGDACDDGDKLPYTYWFRRGKGDVTQSPRWMIPCTAGGGAIAAEGDNVIAVEHSSFYGNEAELGGAVHLRASEAGDYFTKPASRVYIDNIIARNNVALYDGGAVSAAGTSNNRQVYLTIVNSTITGNFGGQATEDRGGGIVINKAFLTINDSDISGNRADIGGGMSFRNANVEATRCTVHDNVAVTRRGFSAGIAIEDASNVRLDGASFGNNTVVGAIPQKGLDIYLGDGLLTCRSICEAGTYEYAGERIEADCANAVYEDCNPTCYNMKIGAGNCTLCGQGKFNPIARSLDEASCMDCPPGTSSDEMGVALPTCASCPAGKFSVGGARNCTPCPAGEHAPSIASGACSNCTAGKFSPAAGYVECDICNISTYADAAGSTACELCPSGRTTMSPLTTSIDGCLCGTDTLQLASGECVPCDTTRVNCPGGSRQNEVLTLEGFYLKETAPSAGSQHRAVPDIYKCLPASDCPSDLVPGACPEGHDGLVCAKCAPGYSRLDGTCQSCEDIGERRIVIQIIGTVVFVGALGGFLFIGRQPYQVHSTLKSVLGQIGGCFITYMQLHFVLIAMSVQWPALIQDTVFQVADALSFNDEHLALDCDEKSTPLLRFLPKLILFPTVLAGIGVMWVMASAVPRLREALPFDALCNAWGYVCSIGFVPLAAHTTDIFNCYTHPNLKKSMRSNPALLCYEGEWADTLLPIGLAAFCAFVVGIYAVFLYLTWRIPRMPRATTRLGFLIVRFRPDIYYWSIPLLTRNLLFSLAPIVAPDKPFVVAVIIVLICTVYTGVVIAFHPWKFQGLTLVDAVTTANLAVTIVAGIAFADARTYPNSGDTQDDEAWKFLSAVLILPPIMALVAFAYALFPVVSQALNLKLGRAKSNKAYDYSLSDLRAELRGMSQTSAPVFKNMGSDPKLEEAYERNLAGFSAHDVHTVYHACMLINSILLGDMERDVQKISTSSTPKRALKRVKSRTTGMNVVVNPPAEPQKVKAEPLPKAQNFEIVPMDMEEHSYYRCRVDANPNPSKCRPKDTVN